MFETWPYVFEPPPRHVVDPPMSVSVNLAVAIARIPPRHNSRPLRVRAEGLSLDEVVPGKLWAWARVSTGEWLCLLSFRAPTGNGKAYLEMKQWCPAESASPVT
ncbi:hypothetical protein JGU71_28090 [Antrihabitans sp. YC3-6]|uniref:Uncharacterized protein n=1 Tax=Antrihabitans stalagmiti TaxID=2799499 RepID=A0A934NWM7_9NOCA|nr:hypothetical protein [Antrihabitans stalagmiti]MBJ8342756.1 hypothetical protein [Antrihabitans stalagmiti]